MKLNKNLPTPLYYQVQEILDEKISLGQWEEGFQLPTEKELARLFNVSTITVKRAVQELVKQGKLYRVRGKGTFVSKKVKEKNIFDAVTFGGKEGAMSPHKLIYSSVEPADDMIANKLKITKGDQVISMMRLKYEDDVPAAIEYSYLVYDLCKNFSPLSTEKDLIYNVVQQSGVQLDKVKINFSSIVAGAYEADVLNIKKGAPLFVIERVTYTNEKIPVEYSKFVLRHDKVDYYIEFNLHDE
jgi:GntR family transcriptional regulator